MSSKQMSWLVGGGLIVLVVGLGMFMRDRDVMLEVVHEEQEARGIEEASSTGEQVPDLTLTDFEGNQVRLHELMMEGPVVLNSWASWCGFCVEELPAFVEAHQALDGAVSFVAINRQEKGSVAREFADEYGGEELLFLLDPKDDFYRSIVGLGMPETLFVKQGGAVMFHKRGPMRLEEIRQRAGALVE